MICTRHDLQIQGKVSSSSVEWMDESLMQFDHLGPESSSGRRLEVESAMIQSVLGLWVWLNS